MGVPRNVQLHQAALNAQNPGAAVAPAPEPLPAIRSMDVVWSLDNPGDIGEQMLNDCRLTVLMQT